MNSHRCTVAAGRAVRFDRVTDLMPHMQDVFTANLQQARKRRIDDAEGQEHTVHRACPGSGSIQ
jgi:hypothetical protein